MRPRCRESRDNKEVHGEERHSEERRNDEERCSDPDRRSDEQGKQPDVRGLSSNEETNIDGYPPHGGSLPAGGTS